MQSNLWKLNVRDFFQGLVSAVFIGVLVALVNIVSNGFSIFTANWTEIGQNMINAGFIAFVGYLGTQFLSGENGKLLGRI